MNINNFPVEILEAILLHLPLSDRKIASRVCRSWAQISFSWPCLRWVELCISYSSCGALIIPELDISQRRYHNVCFRLDRADYDQRQLECFYRVLHKFSTSLERLRFVWDAQETPFNLKLMLAILEQIPTVKELEVQGSNGLANSLDFMLPIEIKALKNLEQVCLPAFLMDDIQFDLATLAPNVKSINVTFNRQRPWDAIRVLIGQLLRLSICTNMKYNFRQLWEMNPAVLEKLQLFRACSDLMETNDIKVDKVRHFFLQCGSLTELILELQVPITIIQVIAENCPLIKKMNVYEVAEGWQILFILQQLEKLTHLKITATFFDSLYSHVPRIFLPNLRHLILDTVELENALEFFNFVEKLIPNLNAFDLANYNIHDDESYNQIVLKSLFQAKLKHLQKLVLNDITCVFPSHLLNHFNSLPHLTKLSLTYYDLLPWNRPIIIPAIRQLTIDVHHLSHFQLRQLLPVFPSLIRLDLVETKESLNFTLDDLRSMIPGGTLNIRRYGNDQDD